MKVCANCKSIYQNNSLGICPKCNTILDNNYSLYDKKDLVNDISSDSKTLWSISWKVFLMIFGILGVLGVVTGFNIYSYFNKVNEGINKKIAKEFEKPNITAIVGNVAKENANALLMKKIEPEVILFHNELSKLKSRTDSILNTKTLSFEKNIDSKSKIIDNKMIELDESLRRIEQSEKDILKIEKEMSAIKDLAQPPTLKINAVTKNELKDGLKVIIQFKPSKNEPLGKITFKVTIINSAEILNKIYLDPTYGGFTGSSVGKISNDKKTGQVELTLIGSSNPTFILEISDKCDLLIEGNYLKDPIPLRKEQY